MSGIVTSILKAHNNLAPGDIYLNRGYLENCGRNRSVGAYLNNPQGELERYPNRDSDMEMLLLRFTKAEIGGTERHVGVINWFGIHPTDRGQKK